MGSDVAQFNNPFTMSCCNVVTQYTPQIVTSFMDDPLRLDFYESSLSANEIQTCEICDAKKRNFLKEIM